MMRVAIMTDIAGWHGARLRRAFKARGVQAKYVSFTQCAFDLSNRRRPVVLPGFADTWPDAVFVRAIPAGSFEQVTLRLSVLHALRDLGVVVFNDARAIERSVDKAMTSFLLQRAGVASPPTWVTESSVQARRRLLAETARGHDVVAKPLFGSQGQGLVRLGAGADLPQPSEYAGVYYLQRYVDRGPTVWQDWRVLVAGDRPIAAMLRHGKSWISNVAQGARCEPVELTAELGDLACAATRAVGADYAGVDIVRDREGLLQVLEVNSIPAWKGLQSVTGFDVAQCLVDDLLSRKLQERQRAIS